ncbi:MAG: hypothetical protein NTY60_05330 [Proteobacteria bacterium]|nr:hypothetical protein [Pseudomonadota bacterium]
MKILYLLFFVLFSQASWSNGEVHDMSEVELLPVYCRGTDQIRMITNDTKSVAEYAAIYGESYKNLHHYCWALNSENKLSKMRDDYEKRNEITYILHNIQYVLDRAPLSFSLIPDIYITRARILFKAEQDVEAIGVLFKLTQIRPSYGPAYAQLGDYYQRIGDRANAIKFYELGLTSTNKANTAFFIWKIRKIDKNYQAPPVNDTREAGQPAQSTGQLVEKNISDVPPDSSEQAPQLTIPPNESAAPAEEQSEKPNPYCRFCP